MRKSRKKWSTAQVRAVLLEKYLAHKNRKIIAERNEQDCLKAYRGSVESLEFYNKNTLPKLQAKLQEIPEEEKDEIAAILQEIEEETTRLKNNIASNKDIWEESFFVATDMKQKFYAHIDKSPITEAKFELTYRKVA